MVPMKTQLKRQDLIYPELSYSIVGCVYDVWNELGPGYSERTYQKATAIIFEKRSLKFNEQLPAPVYFQERLIRDFLTF
jgi:GxxExxY protein